MNKMKTGLMTVAACVALSACEFKSSDQALAESYATQYGMISPYNLKDRCIYAGVVSTAYLRAKMKEEYDHWRVTEIVACGKAGLPL